MEGSKFEPITPSRTRSRSPRHRSRSNSRSIRSRLSRPRSLSRVYSAQAFDDHAVYSPIHSRQNSSAGELATDPAKDVDAFSTTSSEDHDADVEKPQDLDL